MELKKHQEPISVEEQLKNLKKLGLYIEDDADALDFLNNVSYFRFIKAYSLGLKKKNDKYYEGVSFNQLKDLYLFNTDLRQLFYSKIESIEISLRCRISNCFSLVYGAFGYKDSNNFSRLDYHDVMVQEMEYEINRNKRSPFIKNFSSNYEPPEIPFYALVEIMSFGLLSKFFKNMKNYDKKMIAKSYGVNFRYLESWIESFVYIRNVCAHYGRLYNMKLTKKPRLFFSDIKNGVSNERLFGVLVCMKNLNNNTENWQNFIKELELLFQKHPHVIKETMGFQENWKEILLA